jgi:hypothetical protein
LTIGRDADADAVAVSGATGEQPHPLRGVSHLAPRSVASHVRGFMLKTSETMA